MPIFFNPNGSLDLATEPSDMEQVVDGYNIQSQAMQRCKNLRADTPGIIATRDGSSIYNAVATDTDTEFIIIQAGVRFLGTGSKIYRNETAIWP